MNISIYDFSYLSSSSSWTSNIRWTSPCTIPRPCHHHHHQHQHLISDEHLHVRLLVLVHLLLQLSPQPCCLTWSIKVWPKSTVSLWSSSPSLWNWPEYSPHSSLILWSSAAAAIPDASSSSTSRSSWLISDHHDYDDHDDDDNDEDQLDNLIIIIIMINIIQKLQPFQLFHFSLQLADHHNFQDYDDNYCRSASLKSLKSSSFWLSSW